MDTVGLAAGAESRVKLGLSSYDDSSEGIVDAVAPLGKSVVV
jgi:hypothetical protein